jgi:hypothetical protein
MNAEINFVDCVLASRPDLIVHTSDDVPAVRHVLYRDYETRSRISRRLIEEAICSKSAARSWSGGPLSCFPARRKRRRH